MHTRKKVFVFVCHSSQEKITANKEDGTRFGARKQYGDKTGPQAEEEDANPKRSIYITIFPTLIDWYTCYIKSNPGKGEEIWIITA